MSKAFDKRVKTLLPEYKNQFKSNKFNDKRFGENDAKLSLEEKMFKRFTLERQKNKVSKFNLNDENDDDKDDELTHFGQSLAQIEKFDRHEAVNSDDDEDDENDIERGKISAKIVSENFFGGFDNKNDDDKKKNRKEWIEEMISKSKQLKYQKRCDNEKTLDLTEQLDKDWKELSKSLGSLLKQQIIPDTDEKLEKSKKGQDYDMLVQTLKFDLKAQATDKLKTPEEIEKERVKSLKEAEAELFKRMNLPEDEERENGTTDYRVSKTIETTHISPDDMDFNDFEFEPPQQKKHNVKPVEENNVEKEEINHVEGSEIDGDKQKDEISVADNEEWLTTFNKICENLSNSKLSNQDFDKQIREIIKNLNPGLNENNKQRLYLLSQHLVELYKTNCLNRDRVDFELLDCISKILFHTGTNFLKEKIGDLFYAMIKDLNEDINNDSALNMPNLDTLFVFKLISLIFPTSDYQHKVVTPALILMNRYLYSCNIKSIMDCYKGLFLTSICYEFILRSKRYIPECIDYLNSCLYMAIHKDDRKKSIPEFNTCVILKTFKLFDFDLLPSSKIEKLEKFNPSIINKYDENIKRKDLNLLKVSIVNSCVCIIEQFIKLYESNLCFKEMFSITLNLFELLPFQLYPIDLQTKISELKSIVAEASKKPKAPLQLLNKKPMRLKLLEPKIEAKSKFDPRHHNTVISEKQLQARRYKKEYKSAVKEVRKDNQFIANIQFKEAVEKDMKRNKKVKEIMSSLSLQEGEYNTAKRLKNS